MKFKLSCVVDAELIGPITELLGPYGPISWRMMEGEGAKVVSKAGTLVKPTPIKRRTVGFLPQKGLGGLIALRVVATLPAGASANEVLKQEFEKAGLATDGAGATLSKLRVKGYLRHPGKGIWGMTPKGEAAWRKHEHATPSSPPLTGEVLDDAAV